MTGSTTSKPQPVRSSAFGYLTMAATPDAVVRSCALARSLRLQDPDMPVALIVAPPGLEIPRGFFDEVLFAPYPEPFRGELRYLNKLHHPIRLTPFERTLFLDDDTLVIRPLRQLVESEFARFPVALNTRLEGLSDRSSMNHLMPGRVIDHFGIERCRNVYGGGHMYFRRCDEARDILCAAIRVACEDREVYEHLSGQTVVSDEVALMVVANERGLDMPTLPDFVDAYDLWQANQISVEVRTGTYRWPGRPWGRNIHDVRILHFCSRAKRSLPYRRQIHRLTGLRQSFDRGSVGMARRGTMWMRNEIKRRRAPHG